MKGTFWWVGMHSVVRKAIRDYDVWQRNKAEFVSPPRLLEPLVGFHLCI